MPVQGEQQSLGPQHSDIIPEVGAGGWIIHNDHMPGVTRARHVQLLNGGKQLLIKSPSRCLHYRYLGNEYIAWRIARRLKLPALPALALRAEGE